MTPEPALPVPGRSGGAETLHAVLTALTPSAYESDPLLQAVYLLVLALVAMTVLVSAAALALNVHMQWERSRERERSARWEPGVLASVAGGALPSDLAAQVRPAEREAFLLFLLRYALVLDGQSREVLALAAAPHLGLATRMLRHRDPLRRTLAARLLGALGGRDARGPLVALLTDRSPLVAMAAAQALARTGSPTPTYVDALTAALERFDGFGTAAVASMLTAHGVSVGPALAALLGDPDRSESARVAAAEALRRLGDVGAASAAVAVLGSGPPREVSAAALRLLRAVGSPAHAIVARALTSDLDPVVRLHAVAALAALGSSDDAVRLSHALGDESVWVAVRAAHGLREIGASDRLRVVAGSTHPRAGLARQALAE